MNVLHLVQHFKIGGLEKMAATLMQKSQFSDTSVFVSLEGSFSEAVRDWPQLAAFEHRLICLNKAEKFDLNTVRKLSALLKKHNIDVIHSHHIGPMLYASIVSLKNRQIKHVSTIHDAWYLKSFKQRLITKLLNKLTKIYWVADAQVVAKDFYTETAIRTDRTILNGVDFKQFFSTNELDARHELNLPKKVSLIGCSARLELGKGHFPLIRVLSSLPANIELVFAGSGSLRRKLVDYASSLGVSERVHFLGNVQSMQLFYSAINVMCLYSQREGLPLSILESMACGKAIVATDVGGISEVLTHKQGVLVKSGDEMGLKLAVIKAINMKQGECIREHIFSIADANKMSEEYDHFYNGLPS
ncbi:glycosyltransferase [Pseudoalteromonas fuliginea]|uniref:glycosyltransferase n=1 Tax=Pseudoalteromonas fuliginea TaxID=1872678 RepID=UPI0031814F76